MFLTEKDIPNKWMKSLRSPSSMEGGSQQETASWCVAYVKPRCEKKMAQYCEDQGVNYLLPLYNSLKSYPTKKVVFQKPYFPGYVFIYTPEKNHRLLKKCQHLVRLIKVADQALFCKQLEAVVLAISSDIDLLPVPEIKPGILVKIKNGPLKGVEGVVKERVGLCRVCLKLDFIGQGVALQVEADNLEVI
ncbi:MAG TPA: transcription termination/antitermination NusG family protein [Verrucomicrobiota bacterium]|nr:transcription termination/antitermination NusG family protein [Verrucomicrobiota bacterium]